MSVKLLKIDGDSGSATPKKKGAQRVSISKEGLGAIQQLPPQPINLVTIWGAARTGKSFFMNTLAKVDDLFPVSGSMEPCTVGADMSTTVRTVSDLEGRDGARELHESSLPLVGFIDVEGQGDRHLSYEVLLATPLLLLSKVVIFNWKGLPNKSTMLDRLAAMGESARTIGRQQREDVFGHLIILLRDVPSGEEEAKKLILEQEDSKSVETDEEEAQVNSRNKARDLLYLCFRSIQVWCLPLPHPKINASAVALDEVDSSFAAKMAAVRSSLIRLMKEPHQFGGEPVHGGSVLQTLLTTVCEAANKGSKDINPLSMMESIHQHRATSAFEESRKLFVKLTSDLEDGRPRSRIETIKQLDQARKDTLATFTKKSQGLSHQFVSKAREMLDEVIHDLSKACRLTQEGHLDVAKTKLKELVFTYTIRADAEERKITAILSKVSEEHVADAWSDAYSGLCKNLELEAQNSAPESLRQELGDLYAGIIPEFNRALEGKLDHLMGLKRSMDELQSGSEDARIEYERKIREMMENQETRFQTQEKRIAEMQEKQKKDMAARDEEIKKLRERKKGGCMLS